MVQFKYSSSSLPVIIIINISIMDATNTTNTCTNQMNLPLLLGRACVDFPVPKNDKSLLTKLRCIPVNAHTPTGQLRPYPCTHTVRVCWFSFEHDSIENALAPMLDAAAARDVVWAFDLVWTRAIRVNSANARQPHIIQHQSQNIVTAGESRRAATKIFVSVCIGRTKLQHRSRGHWSYTCRSYTS